MHTRGCLSLSPLPLVKKFIFAFFLTFFFLIVGTKKTCNIHRDGLRFMQRRRRDEQTERRKSAVGPCVLLTFCTVISALEFVPLSAGNEDGNGKICAVK
ncbi:hypothetical protein GDO78_015710 [Eleutherodactylus coqui]|uniref:Transmembrane protein n=1 Tax=Eleutherodactylus coqui TaxID=57060 RepID=A0A8J6EKP5_ELECQ|nr:hypothetical protein GDO78_015710 [Eleutherodactylus coqui]